MSAEEATPLKDEQKTEEAAPAASSSSAAASAVKAAFKDPLPEGGAAQFDGVGDKLTFSHTAKCCSPFDFKFAKSDGSDLFTGKTIAIGACSAATSFECPGWCQPFNRLTDVEAGGAKVFSLAIKSGFLDSAVHSIKNDKGEDLGFIEQPTIVQRMSEMWRNRMNIVLRIRDTSNYERWTLRRPGSCGDYQIELCKNYANFEFELSCDCSKYDCDWSKYNCGDCFGQCKLDGPCLKCTSCKQCCEDPRCLCLINAGQPCCDINCWNCDLCCRQACDPAFCKPCCEPGCGCCELKCKDCEVCCKPVCSLCALVCSCNCKPKCMQCGNCKLCRCDNCGANCKLLCSQQCAECKRCIGECPDCKAKIGVFYSKCKPQCTLECDKLKKCIPDFIACAKKCPRRCKLYHCGGKPVHIELDVYGPDGDADVVQTKIMYDGFTGLGCGKSGATLRAGYVCTVHVPRSSPYYRHYHKKERALDFHDFALLTGLAMWYDLYCVAPLAMNACTEDKWTQEELDEHKPSEASAAPNLMSIIGM